MWAAIGEGECLGKAAVSRKSACPLSPEVVVLAQGFSLLEYVSISIKIIYTLSREDRLQ